MKISLIGYGKMGKEIEQLCIKRNHNIYSIADPALNTGLDVLTGSDLAIEFTEPRSAANNIRYCIDRGIPVISGTTGWQQDLEPVKSYCLEKKGCFFYSSNFSIGVNLFWKVSRLLARVMDKQESYSLGLHEIHHDQKKDAPSGTAVTLAQHMLLESSRFRDWRQVDAFTHALRESIPVSSERTGQVPGTHIVEYRSPYDRIVLTHEAFSRTGFVEGVVAVAEWLQGKQGVFGMDDFFGKD